MIKIPKSINFPKGSERFIEYIYDIFENSDTILEIRNTTYIKSEDGCHVGGECSEDGLWVAGRAAGFLSTLVHEFAHYTQMLDEIDIWEEADYDTFFEWLQNDIKLTNSEIFNSLLSIIELERDCEKRAMRLIRRFDMPIDLDKYAQNANTYLYYYHYCFINRQWLQNTTIYDFKIVNNMPKKLVPLSRFTNIDMDIIDLYDRVLNKNRKK